MIQENREIYLASLASAFSGIETLSVHNKPYLVICAGPLSRYQLDNNYATAGFMQRLQIYTRTMMPYLRSCTALNLKELVFHL
ncbi:hypothetical protein J6590_069092 [Homalodisca vitripennis]|nr:hypothetical protein J6590_069092 [Homalodisca vitripennis]